MPAWVDDKTYKIRGTEVTLREEAHTASVTGDPSQMWNSIFEK